LFVREAERDCGWITSAVCSSALDREIALAFVRRGHDAPGTELLAGERGVPVMVAELPFV
jgi:glycine cleavage system aminomethyltransferase T